MFFMVEQNLDLEAAKPWPETHTCFTPSLEFQNYLHLIYFLMIKSQRIDIKI